MSPRQQSPWSVEYVLLGLLAQQPAHGYDLHKKIQEPGGIGMIWHIKPGKLYALLEKLEGMGWLESSQVPAESHPMRREFRVTQSGRAALSEWTSSSVQHGREMRQEFLARLYFARLAGPETAAELLESQKKQCRYWLEGLSKSYEGALVQGFTRTVLHFRIHQVEAMLEWLEECCLE